MANQPSIITRDVDKIAAHTGNVYESVVVISKRSRQIAVNIKEELNNKLADFATTVDNLEEVFENREQIEISKFYERMPKPTTTALEEFLEGTANPYYGGAFGYGRPMKGHGWQPWSNADLMGIMADQIAAHAPRGADLSWKR